MTWNPNTHCSFCGATPETWRGVVTGPGVNVCADCLDLCRALLADRPLLQVPPGTEPIGPDVRVIVTSSAGHLLDERLDRLALLGRTSGAQNLPAFLYRDPIDAEDPDAPRPLRRARLAVLEHGPLDQGDK